MSLFVAQHQHAPERCPAANPQMGHMLLAHLSADNAASHGITIQAEAVVIQAGGERRVLRLRSGL